MNNAKELLRASILTAGDVKEPEDREELRQVLHNPAVQRFLRMILVETESLKDAVMNMDFSQEHGVRQAIMFRERYTALNAVVEVFLDFATQIPQPTEGQANGTE